MKGLLQTVVVAVSGSEASINAAKYGIALAKVYRCRLLAVYVVDTATLRELLLSKIFVEDESAEYEKSLEQNGQRYLDYVAELAAKKGVQVETILRRGAISTEIVEAADENNADLILLGGFEEKGPSRHAQPAAPGDREAARCSVLIVKEPDIEAIFKKL